MQYATTAQAAAALIDAYMIAGGNNPNSVIAQFLAGYSDAELVDEMLANWETEIDRDTLISAMADYRESFTIEADAE